MINSISVTAAADELQGVTLVDIRPTAAYNGWVLRDEPRGGHIPGAVSFPWEWAARCFDGQLVDRLAEKGITPAQPVLIYGYNDAEGVDFAERLAVLGFDQVSVLEGGQPAWAAREDLDLIRLPEYHRLVHPDWLHRLLSGDPVEEAPEGDIALFHVNFGIPQDYERGHIPGAFYLDTNVLESSEDWNRRSPDALQAALQALGITRSTPVVVYGNDTARDPRELHPGRRAGQIAATRAAAILRYAGVDDVRLLDGGLNTWRANRFAVETEPHLPTPVTDFGVEIPANPGVFVDFEEADDLLDDPDGVLVSIRSKSENVGETSGYNYIEALGDIPGAVWGDSGTDAYHMENYRNVDNTMREYDEIEANWRAAGITPDKKIAFYCGTGWRASEAFFYASLMGWPQVSIYDGGWFEWSRRKGLSV